MDKGFYRMRNHPNKITCAIDLFYKGVSTRKVQEHFKENQKVLGIATELKMADRHSFEFCLLDFPEWTETEEKKAEEIKSLLGIFKDMEMSRFNEDEYPIKK